MNFFFLETKEVYNMYRCNDHSSIQLRTNPWTTFARLPSAQTDLDPKTKNRSINKVKSERSTHQTDRPAYKTLSSAKVGANCLKWRMSKFVCPAAVSKKLTPRHTIIKYYLQSTHILL